MGTGRGRDNTMYGQEKFLPGEAALKGGIVCLGGTWVGFLSIFVGEMLQDLSRYITHSANG